MKKNMTLKETIAISSMLFGMFFGAGNLIFPVHLGQLAGRNIWPAIIGFIITGVGLPLLGVMCLGTSNKESLFDLGSLVGDKYKYFFTMALYLTIGPFFAIPRCATTSFTVGFTPFIGTGNSEVLPRFIFTLIFFGIVLFFALKPSGIMTWIGKMINPLFLIFLLFLIIIAFVRPITSIASVVPDEAYANDSFFKGFLEGYNTMDAIASLAFGITVIEVLRNLGIKQEKDIAFNTLKAGFFSCLLMAIIYIAITMIGAMSRGNFPLSSNGGIALSEVSNYYFGSFGTYFLLIVVSLACLKTALGLVISCSEMFNKMFPKFLSKTQWAIVFTVFSFVVSNFGLDAIIKYSIPVLMFLYPLTISLILLALFGKFFNFDRKVFMATTTFNLVAAFIDFVIALPPEITDPAKVEMLRDFASKYFPLFNLGLGWVIPTLTGLVVGLVWREIGYKTVK